MNAKRDMCVRDYQSGVALFTVLVFLVALTMLAIVSMRGSTLSERMARNGVDKSIAMQAAEAALRDAQADILWVKADGTACSPSSPAPCRPNSQRPIVGDPVSMGFNGDTSCTSGQCYTIPSSPFPTPVWEDSSKWTKGVAYGSYTGAAPIPMVVQQPKYLIEGFRMGGGWKVFRISAIGYGADVNTQVMLQSIFVPASFN